MPDRPAQAVVQAPSHAEHLAQGRRWSCRAARLDRGLCHGVAQRARDSDGFNSNGPVRASCQAEHLAGDRPGVACEGAQSVAEAGQQEPADDEVQQGAGRPAAGEYRWFAGLEAAAIAASTMGAGVGKSGSPAPKPMTGRPAALRALALESTARVADGAMAPRRLETRGRADSGRGEVAFTPPLWHCHHAVDAAKG